jgi:O-antigen/teichoic acid export membrane protein
VIAVADMLSQILVVALWVSPEDYGAAMLAMVFWPLLDTAADFGVTASLIQREDHTPERIATVFWFNMLISGGLFVALCVIGPAYGYLQNEPIIGWLLIGYGARLVIQNMYAIPFALLRKELRFGEIAKARIVAHFCESVGRVVFALAGATIWCWTLAALTRSLSFGIIIQARYPFVPKLVFRPREVIEYVRFGLRAAASQLLFRLYTSLDVTIVGALFGKHDAGVYGLALFIVLEPVKTISNVVIDVAFPTFAKLRTDREGVIKQFIQFTRLNLLAVLPFVVFILLVIPEFLRVFYSGGEWTADDLAVAGDAARVLCLVGALRALSFVGPPLLDGLGHPQITLRYMVSATIAVPGSFVLFGWWLGPSTGLVSVAIAWAVGYPFAFLVLMYLIAQTVDLPVGRYLRESWGIIGCCAAGGLAGLGVSMVLEAGDLLRMVAITLTSVTVMLVLLVTWQKITPKSIKAAL